MSLLPSEVIRLQFETGWNLLTIGALPYVQHTALFDQVIVPFLSTGAATTSSTVVAASTSGPQPQSLVLASATGYAAGARVVIDVDSRQETVTVQSVTGSTISALLSLAHSGTYPVEVEGGETLVRQMLAKLSSVADQLQSALGFAGLKRAEEVEWYQGLVGGSGSSVTDALRSEQMRLRDELCSMLGIPNGWRQRRGGGCGVALY